MRRVIRFASVLALAGLGLATFLIIRHGWSEVLSALAVAGPGLVWASLFHFAPMLANARAWQALVPGRGRPRLGFFLWIVWVRESVNGLLPVARIGGEVASARLMIQRGLGTATTVATLVVDTTLGIATQFLVTIAALGLLAARIDDEAIVARVALGVALAIPVVGALLLVQRVGFFELLRRARHFLIGDREWSLIAGGPMRVDRAVRLLYRRRSRVLVCCVFQTAGWMAGTGEIYLFLLFLGHPVDLVDAFILEALAQAVSSAAFVVPGALGVQEGGFLLFGQMLGLSPETALALALARRVRDLVIFLPPLLLWQAIEGRRLLRGRRRRGWPAEQRRQKEQGG
jgi:putative membrane protein